ncbi:hypothetical protein G7Y89_g6846 [Cudoniella acicularis]|uniref:Acyltransferase 3 domain-containing protein n=1 Tax=Cudoniella acicularis TaxID=354080 RepID=A0A8H4RLH3_9HELO|nr:hypothetical protein G7Y89_g6846 [Cudoniella acicularis]
MPKVSPTNGEESLASRESATWSATIGSAGFAAVFRFRFRFRFRLHISSLSFYIAADTIRAFCEYYVFNTTSGCSPPSILVLSEFLKLATAAIYLFSHNNGGTRVLVNNFRESGLKEIFKFAIPAVIDITNNLCYFAAVGFVSPKLVQLFWLARLPTTACLHHIWLKRQGNVHVWASFVWVCIGLLCFKAPPMVDDNYKSWLIATVTALLMAATSALSNIASESLTKSGTFWQSQFWLYAWGFFVSVLSYPITSSIVRWSSPDQAVMVQFVPPAHLSITLLYALATAVVGLSSGAVLRKRDNLIKIVGTASSLLISAAVLYYVSMTLQTTAMTNLTIFGGLVAAGAVWRLNRYHECAPEDYVASDAEEYRLAPQSESASVGLQRLSNTTIAEARTSFEGNGCHDVVGLDEPADEELLLEDKTELTHSSEQNLSFAAIFSATTFGLYHGQFPTTDELKLKVLKSLLFFLPSFVSAKDSESRQNKIHPTAWLDGLRGVAALCVVFQHTVWRNDLMVFTNPIRTINLDDFHNISSIYHPVLWTIPVELRGSMIVYLFLVGCAKLQVPTRLVITCGMCLWFGWWAYWDAFLFLGGMILAELHHINNSKSTSTSLVPGIPLSPTPTSTPGWMSRLSQLSVREVLRNGYWILHFLFATFILSMQGEINYPRGQGDPGYVFLWSLTPSQYTNKARFFRFWPAVGAVYLVWTLDRNTLLQKIFTTRLAQYLGRISFSLYLVHFQIFIIFAEPFFENIRELTGKETDMQYFWGFAIGYAVYFPLTIWISDLFTRGVDEKCVKLSKWMYDEVVGLGK